jgi:aspartyl-tRNA(Asn)/glutamyl-tRNA(Gln) amidotransferase subunit B
MSRDKYEPVIGLEVHVQLATDTKLFCGCKAALPEGQTVADEEANANTCEICTGHPGTLPVLNEKVVDFAIRAGIGTHCEIQKRSVFSRKNYFYPDLPKGYQISQFDLPICLDGHVDIELKGGIEKRIGVTRIHIEEDAGKNVHMSDFSLVNLNRACVPLIEVVSEPDMRSAEEAVAYMKALYSIVTYAEVCRGSLQEGHFRVDANVSVRPKGQEKFGTRAEIKNVNSFRFVEKAIEYEIDRQIQEIENGGTIVQETRGYDSGTGKTFSMRSKEEAHDYRYFPEPDLIELRFDDARIERVKSELPELPEQIRERLMNEHGLSSYDAGVLLGSKEVAGFFEEAFAIAKAKSGDAKKTAKTLANFIAGEVSRLMNEENKGIGQSKLTAQNLADLVPLVEDSVISSTGAKTVMVEAWTNGGSVDAIVEAKGLRQISDSSALEPMVAEIIQSNPKQVEQYKGGKVKLIGFFVGQAMKSSGGKANPGMLKELFERKLAE